MRKETISFAKLDKWARHVYAAVTGLDDRSWDTTTQATRATFRDALEPLLKEVEAVAEAVPPEANG